MSPAPAPPAGGGPDDGPRVFLSCGEASGDLYAAGLARALHAARPSVTLRGFGGDRPYIALLADRPDELPRAQCFPGAHSSSGFAMICGYFVLRDRSRRRARMALAAGVLAGVAFSIGQEARGAHFLSHDLAAAAVVWFSQLLLYRRFLMNRGTAGETPRAATPARCVGS